MAEAPTEDPQNQPQRPLASQFSQLSLTIECGRINSSLSLLKPNPYVEVAGMMVVKKFQFYFAENKIFYTEIILITKVNLMNFFTSEKRTQNTNQLFKSKFQCTT